MKENGLRASRSRRTDVAADVTRRREPFIHSRENRIPRHETSMWRTRLQRRHLISMASGWRFARRLPQLQRTSFSSFWGVSRSFFSRDSSTTDAPSPLVLLILTIIVKIVSAFFRDFT